MIKSQWGLRDPDQIDEKQTRSMLGDFGKVSKKFKDHTSMQDFGAECFEYEMELCGIKRVHGGWNWDEFTDSSGVYQITGSDPFNNPVPNIVAFMWNEDFFNPDYFVCYWTQTEKGSPFCKGASKSGNALRRIAPAKVERPEKTTREGAGRAQRSRGKGSS